MPILLIILATVPALAWRAGVVQRCFDPAGAEVSNEPGLIDACTRTSLLVLGSLPGLLVLGVTYGNVLGAGSTAP
jgi:hypothetical protein